MPNATPSPRQARPTPGLHVIRSPLSRVAYGLAAGAAHLLFLQYGTVHLRKAGSEVSPDYVGPRILWWADGDRRELLAEVGTRGTLLSLPDAARERLVHHQPWAAIARERGTTVPALMRGIRRELTG